MEITGTLTIKRTDLTTVLDHCIAALPNEACGVMGGKDGRIEKVYCMRNVRPGPASYEMDPDEQFRVMKDIRMLDLTLAGIFHSHPLSPAYPSIIDVKQAYWPGTLFPNYPEAEYMIVSLRDRDRPDVRVYRISEGTVHETLLRIT